MQYEGPLYRPPSEWKSLILQITIGCKHNACTFCAAYKHKRFRVRTQQEITEIIEQGRRENPNTERIFLADGDALAIETPMLVDILARLYSTFPKLKRVGTYGAPKDILEKSPAELAWLKAQGLSIVYLGVETGSERLLKEICKGVTAQQMIEAGRKVITSGLLLSCMVITGLGGKKYSQEHALETAKVINAIDPQYFSPLTLVTVKGTPFADAVERGEIELLAPMEALREIRDMVSHLELTNCVFRSNHVSNYLPMAATFPNDQASLLRSIDDVVQNNKTEKLRPEHWRNERL